MGADEQIQQHRGEILRIAAARHGAAKLAYSAPSPEVTIAQIAMWTS